MDRYITLLSNAFALNFPQRPPLTSDPRIHAFRRAIRRLSVSNVPHRRAPPLSPETFDTLLLTLSPRLRPVVLLAYRLAARVGDILSLRADALSIAAILPKETHFRVARPLSKTEPFGLPRSQLLVATPKEAQILFPLCSPRQTDSHPLSSPLMFPGITTEMVARALSKTGCYTAHSLRRGALQTLAAQELPEQDIRLLSLHRSPEALAKYLAVPTPAADRTLVRASRATWGSPDPSQASCPG